MISLWLSHSVIFMPDILTVVCQPYIFLLIGYSKSPSLALGTYFAPRMSLCKELPYGVSRCLLLDISPFSPLCMHRKAHTRRFVRIADNRKER